MKSPPTPAVEVHDLSVIRGSTAILDHLTISIPAGACTAILGPNGCGKTTFTRVLTGHTFFTQGSVRVLGETLGETDIRALRRRIGVVNPSAGEGQVSGLTPTVDGELSAHQAVLTGFFGTVGLYDRPHADQIQRADALLAQVGLLSRRDLAYALLSSGEQRRCLLARAMAHMPELLILDEPTAGLDLAGREQVLATVEKLLARPDAPTVLMISHHVEELSPRTRQVILMRQGRIAAVGNAADVITPELLSATFGCKVFVKKIHGRYWLEVLPEAWLDLAPPTP